MDAGDPTPSFAQVLRRGRQALGLTQEELAERASVSWRAISDLERGVKRPRKDTVALLADALALEGTTRTAFDAAARRVHSLPSEESGTDRTAVGEPQPSLTLPAGMLTFLITDVRGYTAYTHQHGDEAGAALATRFAALAGEAVTAHEGLVVEVRGDEVLAVFTSARRALRAAVDLLRRCAAAETPDLPLRAGVG
ncbi:MAG: helix-turn-helix domain-containing protein, partial [Chloroflexota bacterium]